MRRFIYTFILVILANFYLVGQEAKYSDYLQNFVPNIAYANNSPTQKLDIYVPKGKGPFPVIIAIHGGAWLEGSKTSEVSIYLNGLKGGYAVVSIDYRLSDEARFPHQIYDVKAAIRWVRANGKIYNLNTDKIAAWGCSAGAHLASLAGVSCNVAELEDLTMGNPSQSSCVQAAVDWFGPTDFPKMDEQLAQSKIENPALHSAADSPESRLLGSDINDIPELVKQANPETYVSPDNPPFFIQHGTADNTVPYQQSKNFASKLSANIGNRATLKLVDGAGHGTDEFYTDESYNEVFNFLDKYLK